MCIILASVKILFYCRCLSTLVAIETLNFHRLMLGKSCPLGFLLVPFLFSAVLIVCVPLPFGVYGRLWNLIVLVPDHDLFIYFTLGKRKLAFIAISLQIF